MDIGSTQIVAQLIDGATTALADYSSIFVLIGGIVLAMGLIEWLSSFFAGKDNNATIETNRD
jgi:uncharacterized membrane protein YphA (DoxX/SURF4 family)